MISSPPTEAMLKPANSSMREKIDSWRGAVREPFPLGSKVGPSLWTPPPPLRYSVGAGESSGWGCFS